MKREFQILGKCIRVMVSIVGFCTCVVGGIKLLEHHQQKRFYDPDQQV